MQLINNALLAIAIWSGAAVVAAISIVAIAALLRRRTAVRHVRAAATGRPAWKVVQLAVPALR
jgi:hypothetical protein